MKVIIYEITKDDKEIDIIVYGSVTAAEMGTRDSYGAPIEPDLPAYTEIDDIIVDGERVDLDELAEMLGQSVRYTSDLLHEAIADAWEEEEYFDSQINYD